MLRVPIDYAKPGMVLAVPIYNPRRHDTALLKAGMTLDDWSIGRLAELRIREIWVRYPGMDFIAEYICPAVFEAQAVVNHRIAEAFDAVARRAHARLEYSEFYVAIRGLLNRLLINPKACLFVQELAEHDEPALRHASNVCLVSLLMGLKLEDYIIAERSRVTVQVARDIAALGVGAMLHDIGMLRLGPDTFERWCRTQDESDPDFQRHVHIGHELVKDAIGAAAAAGVLHHHQKFDGSGFPPRSRPDGTEETLAGSDIHIFARIIAGADLFDRLRHPPGADPDQRPTPVVRVLRALGRPPYARWLDPMVYKALIAVVPAYAPGSIVRLSDGRHAVVVDWFADDPCRPTVCIINDPARYPLEVHDQERIALRRRSDLFIAEAEGQNVSADNFYPAVPGEFDLRLAFRAAQQGAARDPLARAG